MTRAEEIDAAMETASRCRRVASVYRQIGFKELAKEILRNAANAEKWAAKR